MKNSSVQSILVCPLMQLGDGDGQEEGGGGGGQESGEVARSTLPVIVNLYKYNGNEKLNRESQ